MWIDAARRVGRRLLTLLTHAASGPRRRRPVLHRAAGHDLETLRIFARPLIVVADTLFALELEHSGGERLAVGRHLVLEHFHKALAELGNLDGSESTSTANQAHGEAEGREGRQARSTGGGHQGPIGKNPGGLKSAGRAGGAW